MAERVASENPPNPELQAAPRSMHAKRLNHVVRTGGGETARAIPEETVKCLLIEADGSNQADGYPLGKRMA